MNKKLSEKITFLFILIQLEVFLLQLDFVRDNPTAYVGLT